VASNITTTGYLPVFTEATTIADLILFETAIGIGDVPNASALPDVNGKAIVGRVSRAGNATPTAAFVS
jgi:hypothetical protein